jgi:ClpP class serine protease
MTNSKLQSLKKDLDTEMKEIKTSLERRIEKQEEQMSEIVKVIKTMNEDMEQRMAYAVLAALIKEKEKVQELTHGRTFSASEAPLADEVGNLPYGGKVQLGGPLHRLHYVEVTLQQMSTALDAILSHMQKDPTAQYLFKDDDESETPTIIENQHRISINKTDQYSTDVSMPMRDFSGAKRQLSGKPPTTDRHGPDPDPHSSPQRSPPPKKERSDTKQPSAEPDNNDRERGRT